MRSRYPSPDTGSRASPPPIDTTAMRRVSGQIGSNPAGLYQDEHGQRFYVKSLESAELARNEIIAARLYQLAGAPTLVYVPSRSPNEVATEWLALDKKHVSRLTESERRQAQRWLGVHAWTANWDAAGLHGDNQGVCDGTVLTLDVGGALAYRANGDPKGAAFGTQVDELDTLRHAPDNPHAIWLFADMSDADLRQAIEVVTRLPDEAIRQTIIDSGGRPALADKMIARKADLAHLGRDAICAADRPRAGDGRAHRER